MQFPPFELCFTFPPILPSAALGFSGLVLPCCNLHTTVIRFSRRNQQSPRWFEWGSYIPMLLSPTQSPGPALACAPPHLRLSDLFPTPPPPSPLGTSAYLKLSRTPLPPRPSLPNPSTNASEPHLALPPHLRREVHIPRHRASVRAVDRVVHYFLVPQPPQQPRPLLGEERRARLPCRADDDLRHQGCDAVALVCRQEGRLDVPAPAGDGVNVLPAATLSEMPSCGQV